jgi:hypothetical protein
MNTTDCLSLGQSNNFGASDGLGRAAALAGSALAAFGFWSAPFPSTTFEAAEKLVPMRREAPPTARAAQITTRETDLRFSSKPYMAAELLHRAIQAERDSSDVHLFEYIDPEEGWTKLVVEVSTGLEDFDERMDLEDRIYALAATTPALREAFDYAILKLEA